MKTPSCLLCWLATCLAFVFALGCSPSDPANGTLTCGSGPHPCPDGYYCASSNKCWKNNTGPDGGSSNSTGGSGGAAALEGGVATGGESGRDVPEARPDIPLVSGDDAADDVPAVSECAAGEHSCGGKCVRNDDPSSCGNACSACPLPQGGTATCNGTLCGGSCPTEKVLCNGACVAQGTACSGECPTGTHACNGLCLSSGDVTGCGPSCTVCPVPTGASQATCDGTKCGFACNSGYHACDKTCARDDSPSACGTSCTTCPTDPNGMAVCVAGGCSITCNSGYHYCASAGKCLKDVDPASCGTSCAPCPSITGGTATCVAGACGGSCPGTQKVCNGACLDSAAACGPCPAGSHNCNGMCASDTSPSSCGASCTACPSPVGAASVTCSASGACAFTCTAGRHQCGTTCAADDDANACGTTCKKCPADPNGTPICQNGECSVRCSSGYHNCNGACASNTDLATCGLSECTVACKAPVGGSVTCSGTACIQTCPTGLPQNCNGTCIAQNAACNGTCPADKKYCSSSGTCIAGDGCCTAADCPTGGANTVATCTSNSCGIACSPSSDTKCGTDCFDLTSNAAHCGACGTNCGSSPSTPQCHSGSCVQCLNTSDCPAGSGKVCSNYQCTCSGSTPLDCGGTCIASCPSNKVCNTTTHQCACSGSTPLDCGGTCIASCSSNKVCNTTTHQCACSNSTPVDCNGTCVSSSDSNCGACGRSCGEGGSCISNDCHCRQPSDTNLIANPGLDATVGLNGWSTQGSPPWTAGPEGDKDGCPNSGSVSLSGSQRIYQCIRGLTANRYYAFGVAYKNLAPTSSVSCKITHMAGGCQSATSMTYELTDFPNSLVWGDASMAGTYGPDYTDSALVECVAAGVGGTLYDQWYLVMTSAAGQF
jgi:hypothetical protein